MIDAPYTGLILDAIFSALIIMPAWKIFLRVGLSPYISILVLLPYIGFLLVVAVLAFMPWQKPTLEEGNPNGY